MSVSLYRKYRPQDFASVIGQSAAVSVLSNAIAKDKAGHAYLFSGSRGCGKTSAARIFAKALNCTGRQGFEPCGKCSNCTEITAGESLDVIEIDGASNNGVDNIRGLKENVALAPFSSRYKIYIIDEVHMLSQGAFNALLKTLEEPPEHVIFIMATTEPHKVPVTIRSRCQHIPFHSITPDDIFSRLEYVCENESITAEPDALREISRQADGALRDALSLLEQVSASGDVTLSNVEKIFGAGSRSAFEKWIAGLRENPEGAYGGLKAMFDAGASTVRVFEELFSILRDLWLVSKWKNITGSLGISGHEQEFLTDESAKWKPGKLYALLKLTLDILTEARAGVKADILLGMYMIGLEEGETPAVNAAPLRTTPAVIPRHEAQNETLPPPVKIVRSEVKDDPALREELLNIAHDRNLYAYCALFSAKACIRGNDLVLDMSNIYCYEFMRSDTNAADLFGLFSRYGNVILSFGDSEYICPSRPNLSAKTPAAIPEKKDTSPVTDSPVKIDTPAETGTPAETYRAESEPIPAKKNQSPFSGILQELSGYGFRPEIILQKHTQTQEDSEDNTDSTLAQEEDDDE